MALEDFSTSDTQAAGNKSTSTKTEEDEVTSKSDAFKVVGSGRRAKVFPTEEDWKETEEYLKNEMRMNPNQVLNMSPEKRHQILHRAILGKNGMDSPDFHLKRDCIVCGETFVFPGNWDFVEYQGEPVCKEHPIRKAVEAYSEINEAADNMAVEQ